MILAFEVGHNAHPNDWTRNEGPQNAFLQCSRLEALRDGRLATALEAVLGAVSALRAWANRALAKGLGEPL